jgi:hypothetical protein
VRESLGEKREIKLILWEAISQQVEIEGEQKLFVDESGCSRSILEKTKKLMWVTLRLRVRRLSKKVQEKTLTLSVALIIVTRISELRKSSQDEVDSSPTEGIRHAHELKAIASQEI